MLALGHASLRQSASVSGTGLWLKGLNLSGLFEPDHQEVRKAEERRGKGFLQKLPGRSQELLNIQNETLKPSGFPKQSLSGPGIRGKDWI